MISIFIASSIIVFAISISLGLFLFINPASAIELQRRFYEKINWKIEPISMDKELRNTKFMGAFLEVVTLAIAIYVLILVF